CGEHTAVSKLVGRSRENCYCIGSLPAELAVHLAAGELSAAVEAELRRLGVDAANWRISDAKTDGGISIWRLLPSSWSGFRPRFELRASTDRLELYDCNITVRMVQALTYITGEAALAELWRATEHDDPVIQGIALRALAERDAPALASRLLVQLRSSKSADYIDAALDALGQL